MIKLRISPFIHWFSTHSKESRLLDINADILTETGRTVGWIILTGEPWHKIWLTVQRTAATLSAKNIHKQS